MFRRTRQVFLCSVIWLWGLSSAYSVEPAEFKAYVAAIAKTHSELDQGQVTDARRRLDETDKSHRGFEFEYLRARIGSSSNEKPAANLIQKIAKPDIDIRYWVLNEVNRELVNIGRDGAVRIYDLGSPSAPRRSVAHPKGSTAWTGSFSRDGKTFVSGHQNGDVLVWDCAKWEIRFTISVGVDSAVREIAVAPDGSAVVVEGPKELELWALSEASPKKVAGVGGRYNFGEGLSFSPMGDLIATGGMFDIILHDAKTGEKQRSMRHASYTMGLEFSPDGKRIASAPRGNVNKFLAVFDVTQDQPLFNAGPFGHYIAGMAFTPDGKRIAATGCEKVLRLFDAQSGEIVLSLPRSECGAKPAFSRDGRLLGWSEPDGFYYIDCGK